MMHREFDRLQMLSALPDTASDAPTTYASDPQPDEVTVNNSQLFFNRELSWLEFNNRVLQEALDPRNPLLERVKFTAIFSSNLDEYFMVRVSGLKQQVEAEVTKRSPDGCTPQEQLEAIRDRLLPLVYRHQRHFQRALRPQLAAHGIYLMDYRELSLDQKDFVHQYFQQHIAPILTPLALDPRQPFPYIASLTLNLVVQLHNPITGERQLARVKVPETLPRFTQIPTSLPMASGRGDAIWCAVPLEQVIAYNLEALFPGMQVTEYYPFRITRDADLTLEKDEAEDLLLAIEQKLRIRRTGGSVVRLEVHASMPDAIRNLLIHEMEIMPEDVYDMEGILCLRDVMVLMDIPLPDLKANRLKSVPHPCLRPLPRKRRNRTDFSPAKAAPLAACDFFSVLRQRDVLVHHPYQSFDDSVQAFIAQAAHDPHVLAIKMTLYRTSGDSPIIESLIAAAENGKQVATVVELKARFDEENNINWARILENVGVHVVYGLVGLKTHTKLVLVVRREDDGLRRYVHVGTGNYNPKTAQVYTDVGLFTSNNDLATDVADLFNYLTGYSRQNAYRKLLVAPVNLRDRLLHHIHQEIDHAKQGRHARIVAQMNALVDPKMIVALYEASQAGVKVDLIVRGICCLRPGVPGISENIRVISIIGQLLEHSRIVYFHNGGEEKIYIGSADWMPRNLDRRVEAMAPIESPEAAGEIKEILGILLADNRQAWELQSDGHYVQRHPGYRCSEQRAQHILMEMAVQSAKLGTPT